MENIKPFGWRRNIDYIKVNFFIMWKSLIEYKIHFYSMFFDQIFYVVFYFIFLFVLSTNFGEVIGWNLFDFVLLMILIDLIRVGQGIFLWEANIFDSITSGSFNHYLVRPISCQFKYFFSRINASAIFYFISDLFLLIFAIIYFNETINLVLLFIISVLMIILEGTFSIFYNSFGFIYIGFERNVLNPFIVPVYRMLNQYPAQFFQKSRILSIFFIFPIFYISSLLIPLSRGINVSNLYLQLLIITILIIIFISVSIINWHYGLKKYKAFG